MRCSAPVKPSYDKREWKFFTIVGWKMLGTISGKFCRTERWIRQKSVQGEKLFSAELQNHAF